MSETAQDKPVWVWTPGQTRPVKAGTLRYAASPVPRGHFQYEPAYRAMPGAFALDPAQLPLGRVRETQSRHRDGLFGCLRDACPEGYGRDMLVHRHGLSAAPSPLELLELSPGDAVGALEICDDIERKLAYRPPLAAQLLSLLDQLPQERASSRAVHQLLEVGTSMGGERPKLTLEHEHELWLAKLQDRGDTPHMPAREYATMQLAALCHLRVAETRLHRAGAGREVLLVRRFDRSGIEGQRAAYLSAHTVLGLDTHTVRGDRARSYLVLADRARAMGVPSEDVVELWRRMVFNGLVHNVDDHPRNHGFVRVDGQWRLAPAFDLVPIFPYEGQTPGALALAVHRDGAGTVSVEAFLASASHFGVAPAEAGEVLSSMAATVAGRWESTMRSAGVHDDVLRSRQAASFAWSEHVAANPDMVREIADRLTRGRRPRLPPGAAATTPTKPMRR